MKLTYLYSILLSGASLLTTSNFAQCSLTVTETASNNCVEDCQAALSATTDGTTGNVSIVWTDGTGATIGTSNSITGLCNGNYTCTITDDNSCVATTTTSVVGQYAVVASFTTDTVGGQAPIPVATTNNSTGATNYLWYFGDGSPEMSSDNPSHEFQYAGNFSIMLVASNEFCDDTMWVDVPVTGTPSIEIPNVFSPNGDGINDQFRPIASSMYKMFGFIYNRYGELIHVWDERNGYWDGRTSPAGREAPEGTYFYLVVAIDSDGVKTEHQGHVQLVR